ncbi:Putative mitochondrial import inner membrane translocase subunit Tim23B, partial [Fulmarus glacialis]
PYLNLDPRYPEQDADAFTFPTGANKTWGRLQLAFFTIGGCYKTGTAFGALGGLQLGLRETQSMVWSKPRNAKYVARQGMLQGNTQGSLGPLPGVRGIAAGGTAG